MEKQEITPAQWLRAVLQLRLAGHSLDQAKEIVNEKFEMGS